MPQSEAKAMPGMARFPHQARRALVAALQRTHGKPNPQDIDLSEYYLGVARGRKACFAMNYGQINSLSCFSGSKLFPHGWKVAFTFEGQCWTGEIQVGQRIQYRSAYVDAEGLEQSLSDWKDNPSAAFKEARRKHYLTIPGTDMSKIEVKEAGINGKLYFGCEYDSVQDVLRARFEPSLENPDLDARRLQWLQRTPVQAEKGTRGRRSRPSAEASEPKRQQMQPGSPALTETSHTDGELADDPFDEAIEFFPRIFDNVEDEDPMQLENAMQLENPMQFENPLQIPEMFRFDSLRSVAGTFQVDDTTWDEFMSSMRDQSNQDTRATPLSMRAATRLSDLNLHESILAPSKASPERGSAFSGTPSATGAPHTSSSPVQHGTPRKHEPHPASISFNFYGAFSSEEISGGLLRLWPKLSHADSRPWSKPHVEAVFKSAANIGAIHQVDGPYITLVCFVRVLFLIECAIFAELGRLLDDEPYATVLATPRKVFEEILKRAGQSYAKLGRDKATTFETALVDPYATLKAMRLNQSEKDDNGSAFLLKSDVAMFPVFQVEPDLHKLQEDCKGWLARVIWRTTRLPPSNKIAKSFFGKNVWEL